MGQTGELGGGSRQLATQRDARQFDCLHNFLSPVCEALTPPVKGGDNRGCGMTMSMNASPATGKNPTDEYLEGMMSEAPGPINFTMFLTMFGEKLNGTDPEDVIRNAFACFDEEASGQQTLGGLGRASTKRPT